VIRLMIMKKIITVIILLVTHFSSFSQRQGDNGVLAQQYFQNGEFDKAASLYEKLFSDQPQNKIYFQNYITSLTQLKEYDKAEKVIKKQIKKYPDIHSLRVDLGILYINRGEEEKGRKEFESAINQLKPQVSQINELGRAFLEKDEIDLAIKTFLKGRKLMNDPLMFSNELTRLYSRKNDKVAIVDELLTLLDQDDFFLSQVKMSFQDYLIEPKDMDVLKSALLKRLQASPERTSYSDLLIWTLIQQRNFDLALIQTIALDKRSNGDGSDIMSFADYCTSNKAYDVAIKAYQNIIDRGKNNPFYMRARLESLDVKNKKITESNYTSADLLQLENDYTQFLSEFGETSQTAFAMQELANLKAQYLNKAQEAATLLEKVVDKNLGSASFIAQCKLDLGDVYLLTGDVWESALLYGQVDKAFRDEPMGQMAKFKNAQLSYYTGEFEWSKAQLDVLKASTSQLIANDALNLSLMIADNTGLDTTTDALRMYSKADLLIYQNRFDEAQKSLDSINLLYPDHALTDEILWAKSKMQIKKNNIPEALQLLKSIYENYSSDIWADDAIYLSAGLYENKLNDPKKAMELYESIILKYPGSLYVVEARKRFRTLRGDMVN
jgi:tetratricopeptide (TPR) repeat protein